ncbi:MAG: NAD(P)/FAD-dependent oxidoreductase [Lactobacillaceae bacterium]|jgi:glutathione reductase (NADPH)|nr:NAD(P)/FAD-dependent oxidoreductase [Lactobacillaceae bacterium]
MAKTNEYQYDVVFLGSGHGTFDGAIPLAAKDYKVGVIEADKIGGTCPNYGCNAKILLDAPVQLQREFERLQATGNVEGSIQLNWSANVQHKDAVINVLPDMIAGFMTGNGITLIHGRGTLEDAHTIVVDGEKITSDKIVLSTGLRTRELDIPGQEYLNNSTDFMALPQMPKQMVIIGSGYIALEFATIANAAGADVTVLFSHGQALKQFPKQYVEIMLTDLQARGVKIVRDVTTNAVQKSGTAFVVETDQGGYDADWVLNATGRVPNVEGIGLEKVGVKFNKNGIVVNDELQTTVSNIYASGDVLDKPQGKLTPTAVYESMYLMRHLTGEQTTAIEYPVIPTVVYTSPRIAQVGVSLDEALAQPERYTVKTSQVAADWYRQVENETLGENALIFEQATGKLVGAVEISDKAEDVINTLLPAIEFGYTPVELARLVYLFPSIGNYAAGLI